MDFPKKNKANYDRVMSRVYNPSRSSLKSSSNVTRHDVPSSVRVGAKPSVSAVSSSVFSELPTVLNDYVPDLEGDKVVKKVLVRPRKTLKSLDPSKVKGLPRPPRARGSGQGRTMRARSSVPTVLTTKGEEWSESHVRQCYSSRSHTGLKELKDEIKAFRETDKLLKIRSHLYKSCGVVLDDVGNVAQDKAVQAEPEPDKENTYLRRTEWLRLINREDLVDSSCSRARVCEAHFSPECIRANSSRKLLKKNSVPNLLLPIPNKFTEDQGIQTFIETADANVQCDYDLKTNAETQTPSQLSNYNYVLQKNAQTQTSHLSTDTPGKGKLSSELQTCRKRLKTTDDTTQSEANMFFKLCDKFLTPTFARIVKQRANIKSHGHGNRSDLD